MQKLTRWGNSTGLRIPAPVMEAAGLKPGSYVSVRLLNSGDIRIRPARNAQAVSEDGDMAHAPQTQSTPKVTEW
jgi:antitoxin MazE